MKCGIGFRAHLNFTSTHTRTHADTQTRTHAHTHTHMCTAQRPCRPSSPAPLETSSLGLRRAETSDQVAPRLGLRPSRTPADRYHPWLGCPQHAHTHALSVPLCKRGSVCVCMCLRRWFAACTSNSRVTMCRHLDCCCCRRRADVVVVGAWAVLALPCLGATPRLLSPIHQERRV